MAKEHFDGRGFPIFSKIVGPIVEFVEALTISEGVDGKIDIINPLGVPFTDRFVTKYVRSLDSGIEMGSRPIIVSGIYVVGGQAQRLPDDYKVGSDIDLVIQTNLEDVVAEAVQAEQLVLYQIGRMLNNGMADWRTRGPEDKPFAIDVYEEGNPPKKRVDAPHLQVYPTLRKVNAVEVSLSDGAKDWILRNR